MGCFVDVQGNYHEGDKQLGDVEVPQRPAPNYKWENDEWIEVPIPYSDKRKGEYPSEIDQLDMLWHMIDDGLVGEPAKTSEFYLARKAVKDKYPKE